MANVPLTPLGVGEILSHAAAIHRERFGDLVRAVFFVELPIAALQLLLSLSVIGFDEGDDLDTGQAGLVVLVALLGLTLSWLAGQLATAACFQLCAGAYVGRRPGWEESLEYARRRLRPVVSVQLLAGLGIVLGLVAFVLPGVYLAIAWCLTVPIVLFERLTARAALRRSRELIRGRWWPTLGLFLVLGLLTLLAGAFVGGVVSGLAPGDNDVIELLLDALGQLATAVVLLPLVAAATTVLYVQALARRGEVDLPALGERLLT